MADIRKDEEAASHIEPAAKRHSTSHASSSSGNHNHPEKANAGLEGVTVAAKLRNPLAGMTEEEIIQDVDAFVHRKRLQKPRDAFRKGALLARVNQRSPETGFLQIDICIACRGEALATG